MYGAHGTIDSYRRGQAAEVVALRILRSYHRMTRVESVPRGSFEDWSNGSDIYITTMERRRVSIDVKSLKRHAPEHILIEHRNVNGGLGWAHRPGIAMIFVSETDAILVDKRYLSLLISDPRKIDWSRPAVKQPRDYVEDFRPYSRPENNDLVAYVPYSQIMRLLTSVRLRWNPATNVVTEVRG